MAAKSSPLYYSKRVGAVRERTDELAEAIFVSLSRQDALDKHQAELASLKSYQRTRRRALEKIKLPKPIFTVPAWVPRGMTLAQTRAWVHNLSTGRVKVYAGTLSKREVTGAGISRPAYGGDQLAQVKPDLNGYADDSYDRLLHTYDDATDPSGVTGKVEFGYGRIYGKNNVSSVATMRSSREYNSYGLET